MPDTITRARSKRIQTINRELTTRAERQLTARLERFFAATARHVSMQLSDKLARDAGKVGKAANAAPYGRELPVQVRQGKDDVHRTGAARLHDAGPTVADLHERTVLKLGGHAGNDTEGVLDGSTRLTKDDADYVDHPVDGERCDTCTMFRPPERCTLVEGDISPTGHCRYWDAADDAAKSSDHPGGRDLHVLPENAVPIQLGQAFPDSITRANLWHVAWAMVHEGEFAPVRMVVPTDALIPTQQVVDWTRVAKHEAALRAGESVEPDQRPPLAILWDDDYFLLGGHHGTQAAFNLGIPEIEVDLMVAPA